MIKQSWIVFCQDTVTIGKKAFMQEKDESVIKFIPEIQKRVKFYSDRFHQRISKVFITTERA